MYKRQVWNLDVCRPFHDDPGLAEKRKVKEAVEMLHDRYAALAASRPDLLDPPAESDGSCRAQALSYYAANTREAGKITLVSNPTGIYGKEPVVFFTLTELMKHAREDVTIHTPYAVFNAYMYDTCLLYTSPHEARTRGPNTMKGPRPRSVFRCFGAGALDDGVWF